MRTSFDGGLDTEKDFLDVTVKFSGGHPTKHNHAGKHHLCSTLSNKIVEHHELFHMLTSDKRLLA